MSFAKVKRGADPRSAQQHAFQEEKHMKSPSQSVPAFTAAVPTADETDKAAIERLRGERDAYNKAQEAAALGEVARVSLMLQESFDAGWQWARTASYQTIKDIAGITWIPAHQLRPGLGAVKPVYGAHDGKEFQAGAIEFFNLLPKD
jgi:hypothetical protein